MIFLISGQSDLCPSLGEIRRKLETESEDGKMLFKRRVDATGRREGLFKRMDAQAGISARAKSKHSTATSWARRSTSQTVRAYVQKRAFYKLVA